MSGRWEGADGRGLGAGLNEDGGAAASLRSGCQSSGKLSPAGAGIVTEDFRRQHAKAGQGVVLSVSRKARISEHASSSEIRAPQNIGATASQAARSSVQRSDSEGLSAG